MIADSDSFSKNMREVSFCIVSAQKRLLCMAITEKGAHRKVGNFGGMEVVSGGKHHHDQAEGQNGFHAPCLAIGHPCGQLVCTTSNCRKSERVNL